jgi:ketosteroid isomerase-like protein
MSTMKPAPTIARYIAAANAQDVHAVTATCSEDAVVRDEGKSRQGIAAVRQSAEEKMSRLEIY